MLPSYTSISNAVVGKTIDSNTNNCIWNTCVTWQDIDYRLPEDDTVESKNLGLW